MTPILERALTLRAKHPEAPAQALLSWARNPEVAPLPWEDNRRTGLPAAKIEQDGFDVRVKVEYDETGPDLSWLGEFHERYTKGAIRVRAPREWRRSDAHGCIWFVPGCSAKEHRDSLHKMGYARAEADRLARSYVYRDAERLRELCNGDRAIYMVGVDVYRAGIRLGSAGLFGIDVDKPDDDYMTEVARDLIAEAIGEARASLSKLCDHN